MKDLHWIWKVAIGLILFVMIAFAVVGCAITVGRPAWNPGTLFQQEVEDPVVEKPEVEDPVVEDPVVEKPVVEDPVVEKPVVEKPVVEDPVVEKPVVEDPVVENTVKPILPDMPGSDLHTHWIGDIRFSGWKGQVSFPHPSQDDMVTSNHAYSLHQISADDKEMVFVVTWGEDSQAIEGEWFVNEYNVENFDWDENSPEQFFDRFVREIQDWTVPKSIDNDTTIPVGTTLHITIFFGTSMEKPYYSFEYTK
jgi:hypothetical protein